MKTVWRRIYQNNSGGYRLDNMPGILWIEVPETVENEMEYVDALGILPEKMVGAPYCPCCGERWVPYGENYEKPDREMTYEWAAPFWFIDKDLNIKIINNLDEYDW